MGNFKIVHKPPTSTGGCRSTRDKSVGGNESPLVEVSAREVLAKDSRTGERIPIGRQLSPGRKPRHRIRLAVKKALLGYKDQIPKGVSSAGAPRGPPPKAKRYKKDGVVHQTLVLGLSSPHLGCPLTFSTKPPTPKKKHQKANDPKQRKGAVLTVYFLRK